jgi:hypothetical protein
LYKAPQFSLLCFGEAWSGVAACDTLARSPAPLGSASIVGRGFR